MCNVMLHHMLRVRSDQFCTVVTHVTQRPCRGPNRIWGKATTHDGNAVSIDLACDPAQALDQGRGSLDTLSASITGLVAVSSQPTLQSR